MPVNLNNIPDFLRDIKNPYKVPDDYFDHLESDIMQSIPKDNIPSTTVGNHWGSYLLWSAAGLFVAILSIWGLSTLYQSSPNENTLISNDSVYTPEQLNSSSSAVTIEFSNSIDSEVNYSISGDNENLKISVIVNPSYSQSEIFIAISRLPFEKAIISRVEAQFLKSYQEYELVSNQKNLNLASSSSKNENYIVLSPGSTMKIPSDTIRSSEFTFKLPQKICSEGEVMLDATLPGGDFNYSWSTGDKSPVLKVNKSGIYQITATSKKKGTAKISGSVDVKILPKPSSVKSHMVIGCVGNPVELSVGIDNPDYKIFWNGLNSFNRTVSVNDPGLYVAVIEGCKLYVDSFYVNFTHCEVFIPNAFSPNNDGLNDTFVIQNIEKFPGTELNVFNRAGQLIYTNLNYDNSWKADNQTDGTYYYKIKFPDGIVQNGAISVLRK